MEEPLVYKSENSSLEDLQQVIQQARLKNAWIQKENNLYSGYLKRISAHTPKAEYMASLEEITLSPEQRFLIATSELKEIHDEIEKTKENSERFLEQLRVTLIHLCFCNMLRSLCGKKQKYELPK